MADWKPALPNDDGVARGRARAASTSGLLEKLLVVLERHDLDVVDRDAIRGCLDLAFHAGDEYATANVKALLDEGLAQAKAWEVLEAEGGVDVLLTRLLRPDE